MLSTAEVHRLASAIRSGSVRALSRGLSWIEAGGPRADALSDELYPFTKSAHVVGITGSPGVGKSTLVAAIATEARKRSIEVGVLAIDPSSPFTGGAILGDRIRMNELSGDRGVFVRSMATRGALGGLSRAAASGVDLLCAAGKTLVLVETVGVGQDEVDIMRLAHTTVVVSVPGLGDDIQALKAGIIEIADIHVVNKADREGADRTVAEIRNMLGMTMTAPGGWQPPIVSCVASKGDGAGKLLDVVTAHLNHLNTSGEMDARLRAIAECRVLKIAQASVAEAMSEPIRDPDDPLGRLIERVVRRELSPYRCMEAVLARTNRTRRSNLEQTRAGANV